MFSRVVLVMALLLALVPLTALADESSEAVAPSTPDQARLVQAEAQIDAASTTADVLNAQAIYQMQMTRAMGSAQANLANAQAIFKAHPSSATEAQLASAQANYAQVLKLCDISPDESTLGVPMPAGPEAQLIPYDPQGGWTATIGFP